MSTDVVPVVQERNFFRVVADVAELATDSPYDIVCLSVDELVEVLNIVNGRDWVSDDIVDNCRHVHGRSTGVRHRRSLHLHGLDGQAHRVFF